MLVDLIAKKVTALNADRKIYMDINNKKPEVKGKPEVNKTSSTKKVAGMDAKVWTVTNKDEATEVSYSVASGNFDFFIPLLESLNRKDKSAVYFQQISGNSKVFPVE